MPIDTLQENDHCLYAKPSICIAILQTPSAAADRIPVYGHKGQLHYSVLLVVPLMDCSSLCVSMSGTKCTTRQSAHASDITNKVGHAPAQENFPRRPSSPLTCSSYCHSWKKIFRRRTSNICNTAVLSNFSTFNHNNHKGFSYAAILEVSYQSGAVAACFVAECEAPSSCHVGYGTA